MKASHKQVSYMRMLEHLTCSGFDTNTDRRHVQKRIVTLKRLAEHLKVPTYKYVPSPVITYFDSDIVNTNANNARSQKS